MKTILLMIAMLLFSVALSTAQSRSDSASAGRHGQVRPAGRMIDENGDGIDDRQQMRRRMSERRSDRFIDKDGDGICDGRESGMGLGFRHGAGKKGASGMGQKRAGQGGRQ